MKSNNNSNQKPIFLMVAALAAIGMLLSVGLVTADTVQQASAKKSSNSKSANNVGDANTSFGFKQDQTNKCSGFAGCSNSATLNFGF